MVDALMRKRKREEANGFLDSRIRKSAVFVLSCINIPPITQGIESVKKVKRD